MLPCIKLLRKLKGISLAVVCDDRVKTKRSVIFACTHIGGVDVETAFEVIRQPCWLFLGDPKEVYKNLDGLMLGLNGVIFLETRDKEDRHIAKETAVQLLLHGGNLLIFPEGAWNISENLPVTGLFSGTAEMAIRSGAEIVPVAVEGYGKHMYAAIGRNIAPTNSDMNKKELTGLIRDSLATLKWQIWEHVGVHERRSIPENYSEAFLEQIMHANKEMSYLVQDVMETMFVDKTTVTREEAFAFVDNLIPSKANAFLLRR